MLGCATFGCDPGDTRGEGAAGPDRDAAPLVLDGGDDVFGGRDTDAGTVGPAALVRVVNLVPGLTFDAFGPDVDAHPVKIARGMVFGTISDYFAAPVNRISQDPIFLLWQSGDDPGLGTRFSTLLDDTHERVRVEMRELDGPGQHGTIVVAPEDDGPDAKLLVETLDEVDTSRGDAQHANLHVSFHVDELPGGARPALAVAGERCLFHGSTSVDLARRVTPGSIRLAVYDTQAGVECDAAPELASFSLEVAAGDNELVVIYSNAGKLSLLHAPLAPLE